MDENHSHWLVVQFAVADGRAITVRYDDVKEDEIESILDDESMEHSAVDVVLDSSCCKLAAKWGGFSG